MSLFLPILLLATQSGTYQPLIMAHYMPWFEARPVSRDWGWHWTMNHFKPEQIVSGRRRTASHYYPLIGPYDSMDPDVLECQTLQMKYAGIDGTIVVWYGLEDVYDYKANHQHLLSYLRFVKKAGLKFIICFEDQTLPNLIKYGKVKEAEVISYGRRVMDFMSKTWFSQPNYVRQSGKPTLLVFGPQFYKADQWKQILEGHEVDLFGVMGDYGFATGGFAWPAPAGGSAKSDAELQSFYVRATAWKSFLGVAYPRFHDIYEEAGVHKSWGRIDDGSGVTFQRTFDLALDAKSPIIQLATWNDWGEGTAIEPSFEFGYRDLEETQRIRRSRIESRFKYTAGHLRLPARLFKLRKSTNLSRKRELDAASDLMFAGRPDQASHILDKIR